MTDGDAKNLLKKALYDGKAIETAPVACTDPECGYVFQYLLDPETQSWDDVPDYVECGRKEHEIPGTSDPIAPEHPRRVHDPCEAPAKVFKDEAVLKQDDRTPGEIATSNDLAGVPDAAQGTPLVGSLQGVKVVENRLKRSDNPDTRKLQDQVSRIEQEMGK